LSTSRTPQEPYKCRWGHLQPSSCEIRKHYWALTQAAFYISFRWRLLGQLNVFQICTLKDAETQRGEEKTRNSSWTGVFVSIKLVKESMVLKPHLNS
jgi:hypothetical protein